MVESTMIFRFVRGDLLFLRVTDAVFCLDWSTGLGEFTNSSIILGGTGRYAGATGTIDSEGKVGTLSADLTGTKVFGWVTQKMHGKILRQLGK